MIPQEAPKQLFPTVHSTSTFYVARAQASPTPCTHHSSPWDWHSSYWLGEEGYKKVAPLLLQSSVESLADIKMWDCKMLQKHITLQLDSTYSWTSPAGGAPQSAGSWRYSVSCLQALLHVTLCSRNPRSWDQREEVQKTSNTLQQEVTVNRNPLSPHREAFIQDC